MIGELFALLSVVSLALFTPVNPSDVPDDCIQCQARSSQVSFIVPSCATRKTLAC